MAHVFVPTDPRDNRPRVLRPKSKINEDDMIHEMSWLDNYYPNRANELKGHSLYNVMANFYVVSADKKSKSPSEDDKRKKKKNKKLTSVSYRWDSDHSSDEEDNLNTLCRKQTVDQLKTFHLPDLV